eukprot:CAMPEP_0171711226 /NCGR_PEP_ID=MMETSP0991-20121206/16447_1 /TAXON_ID=483369 /ORGANISM="non described non described, Strain CCMP2098" /LENGTH=85 /DNA_ID=CAMNT_0012301483 /DNA_START=305 /DNA_END=562 /DNA_ORIENTATION=-
MAPLLFLRRGCCFGGGDLGGFQQLRGKQGRRPFPPPPALPCASWASSTTSLSTSLKAASNSSALAAPFSTRVPPSMMNVGMLLMP